MLSSSKLSSFLRKLNKFITLRDRNKSLFFEALFLQYVSWLILLIIPFKSIPKLFSNKDSDNHEPDKLLSEQIKNAIRYASHISVWKNQCLVQSLAARLMLRRRHIDSRLSLGVDIRTGSKLTAHAWLISDGFEIVPRNGEWREMYVF
jgi:hypothetical protein